MSTKKCAAAFFNATETLNRSPPGDYLTINCQPLSPDLKKTADTDLSRTNGFLLLQYLVAL
jgi:hypothetical protein